MVSVVKYRCVYCDCLNIHLKGFFFHLDYANIYFLQDHFKFPIYLQLRYSYFFVNKECLLPHVVCNKENYIISNF